MKRILTAVVTLLLAFSVSAMAQKTQSFNWIAQDTSPTKKRGPVFRSTKDQIKQAQAILKQRGFYSGEQTGKLDVETRNGLRKYQEAERVKVTGTLNRLTLERMNIPLTEKQRTM